MKTQVIIALLKRLWRKYENNKIEMNFTNTDLENKINFSYYPFYFYQLSIMKKVIDFAYDNDIKIKKSKKDGNNIIEIYNDYHSMVISYYVTDEHQEYLNEIFEYRKARDLNILLNKNMEFNMKEQQEIEEEVYKI